MQQKSFRSVACTTALLFMAFGDAGGQPSADSTKVTQPQQQHQSASQSLDSLLNTHIDAASKYAQTSAEAPSSVTIVTARQIASAGYRNLHEALEGVRGLYVSNDRNYPSLGTRGFSRPSDYNNRILLLVDGHTVNEQVWGSAPVGSDLPVNLDAVERIEIVRGPGSALYGSSAMFGVINIVTKTGAELSGIRLHTGVGSAGTREVAIAAGNTFGTRGAFSFSGIANRNDGWDLYFPDLDAPETNNGFSRDLDWEESAGGLATLSWRGLTARAGARSRSKGIPTGAYGVSLDDARSRTSDESSWLELQAQSSFGGKYSVRIRAYTDRYLYHGVYASAPDEDPYRDNGKSVQVGGEATFVWDPSSRLRMTFGSEYRDVLKAGYYETYSDGSRVFDEDSFQVASLFAQSEFEITSDLTLVTGVRHDHRSLHSESTTPRLALIASPDARTTVKLLYGGAYRAPSVSESQLSSAYYLPNHDLKSERIKTLELELQRRVSDPLLLGASLYSYKVSDLIEQVYLEDEGAVQHRNVSAARASGVELQGDWIPAGILSAQATYALQPTAKGLGGQRLTNSPRHVANVQFTATPESGLRSSLSFRYESGRRTLAGTSTDSYLRTDAAAGYSLSHLTLPPFLRPMELSVRVTNLFDTRYAVPGGVEHTQAMIAQNGRVWSLRLDWRR